MGHIFNDDDVNYADDYEDYIFKNQKIIKTDGIGDLHNRLNWVNLDIDYKGASESEEVGISRKSYEVCDNDKGFHSKQHLINKGKIGKSRDWELPLNVLQDMYADEVECTEDDTYYEED